MLTASTANGYSWQSNKPGPRNSPLANKYSVVISRHILPHHTRVTSKLVQTYKLVSIFTFCAYFYLEWLWSFIKQHLANDIIKWFSSTSTTRKLIS